jgi:hypothetical protein
LLIQGLIKDLPSVKNKLSRHIKHVPLMSELNVEEGMKGRAKSTVMICGVLTLVLVKADCSLLEYDALCTCSADMLEELAASNIRLCT